MRKPPHPAAPGRTAPGGSASAPQGAVYVGSPEHKAKRWWGGLPQAGARRREPTTVCPLVTAADRRTATKWIRTAIASGQYKTVRGDGAFPKHVWYRDGAGKFWHGMCVNRAAGEYKGWPIPEDQWHEIFG